LATISGSGQGGFDEPVKRGAIRASESLGLGSCSMLKNHAKRPDKSPLLPDDRIVLVPSLNRISQPSDSEQLHFAP